MKAVDTSLLTLLKKTPQFVVPIYQRLYSWNHPECTQLWNDVVRAGAHSKLGAHFTGSIVYVTKNAATVTAAEPSLIIDGQQRVTTVSIILAALAQKLSQIPGDNQEVYDGFSPKKIRERYLMDPNEDGDRRFKLLLSEGDREALKAVFVGSDIEPFADSKVVANYKYFLGKIEELGLELDLICKGLEKLVVVDVSLERGVDNPQLVFEAMNSTGKKLSQADLIRNFLLMDLDQAVQTEIYVKYWRPMEKLFAIVEEEQFDSFVRHYLTIRTGNIPRIGDVYEEFKDYFYKTIESGMSSQEIASDLYLSATQYSKIALGQEQDKELAAIFLELEQVKAHVVLPFVLRIYQDFASKVIQKDTLVQILKLVISYVFRRVVCKIPTNSMNKTFASLYEFIDLGQYLESVQAQFLLLQSYRRLPTDQEFVEALKSSDLYNFRRRSYLLRKLENFGRKEPVSIEEYTIEHILPQNPSLSPEWQAELGAQWQEIQEKYLHTLGNLTLTGYNSEYSDNPFLVKRDMKGGFFESPLRLNAGIGKLEKWSQAQIEARAERLSKEALSIWVSPKLSEDIVAKYKKSEKQAESVYGLQDHPNLFVSIERQQLFERFSNAVLDLDPVVTMHFLKLYVAFKAETNFVDVIPQKSKLLLSLNIPTTEIVDPRGIARDVSKISRWGNGPYEVELSENSDFDYVFGLVRQAFDIQLEEDIS
jgi:uncharacterized protein with ParB-like and HNH nuclease domain/predicted transport protein